MTELEEEAWDRQMEQDFSPGGRGLRLLKEVKADVTAGRTKPMEEFLESGAQAKSGTDLQTGPPAPPPGIRSL